MPSLPAKTTSKKLLKNRNQTFPLVHYFTWKLELISNILLMVVALQLSNHGRHSNKLLIGPLIMLQEFRHAFKDTFGIFREGLQEHIEYCTIS